MGTRSRSSRMACRLFCGAQVAVHAALVSPAQRNGASSRPGTSLAKPSAKLRRGSGGQPTRLLAGAGLACLAWRLVGGGRQRLKIAWRVEKLLPARPASARSCSSSPAGSAHVGQHVAIRRRVARVAAGLPRSGAA